MFASRLNLERLEDRCLPSTVTVTSTDGLWRWDSKLGWGHISTATPTQTAIDRAGSVYGTFGDGLWRWSAASFSWQKLSALKPSYIATTGAGVLYGDFEASGVWRWSPTSGWAMLTTQNVGRFNLSNSDAFFGEFTTGSAGTWRWTPNTGWSLLTANRAGGFGVDDAGRYIGYFTAGNIRPGDEGVWKWNPASGWSKQTSTVPTNLVVADNGLSYLTLAGGGISLLGLMGGLTPITTKTGTPVVAPNGDLFVILNDGYNTIWCRTASDGNFRSVVDPAATSLSLVVGSDNDLFIAWGGGGSLGATPALVRFVPGGELVDNVYIGYYFWLSGKLPNTLTGQNPQQ